MEPGSPEARRDQPWDVVWADLHAAREALLHVLGGMGQDDLGRYFRFPWGPEDLVINGWASTWSTTAPTFSSCERATRQKSLHYRPARLPPVGMHRIGLKAVAAPLTGCCSLAGRLSPGGLVRRL